MIMCISKFFNLSEYYTEWITYSIFLNFKVFYEV